MGTLNAWVQKFGFILTDDEAITEMFLVLQNKSMSGNKYRSKRLRFHHQALKQPANGFKRQQQKISEGKMAISNLFSSFICFTGIKSEK